MEISAGVQEDLNWSKQNYLLAALLLATMVHALLMISPSPDFAFTDTELSKQNASPISIKLDKAELTRAHPENESKHDVTDQAEQQDEEIQPAPKMVITKQKQETKKEPPARINLSTQSTHFEKFIQSETERSISNDQNNLASFSASFKPYYQAPEVITNTTYREFQSPLGGGQYDVYTNGKIRCVLHMVPMSFDDHLSGTISGSKDCTPDKKLVLNLRKNTRIPKN